MTSSRKRNKTFLCDIHSQELFQENKIKEYLTLERPMFPSYRNQSVDLLCKSTDWFLYDGNIGR